MMFDIAGRPELALLKLSGPGAWHSL